MFRVRIPTREARVNSGIPQVGIQGGQRLEMEIWKLTMAAELRPDQSAITPRTASGPLLTLFLSASL